MEETIKCAPKIPINLLPSLNTDCIQLKDTLKKSGYKKLFYPFLTLPPTYYARFLTFILV